MKKISFISEWVLLTKLSKSIFRYIQSLSRSYKYVFPSIETIARACKCCARSVNRAIKIFLGFGWLGTLKRGYQSNVYFLDDELIQLNVDDPKNFRNTEPFKPPFLPRDVAPNVAVLEKTKEKEHISTSGNGTHIKNAPKKTYHILERLPLTQSQKRTLTTKFSEAEIMWAFERGKWYEKEGHRITNLFGFLHDAALDAKEFYRKAV